MTADLEEVWRIREEEAYPRLFGSHGQGIFVLSDSLFRERFGQVAVDPRWLFCGVFEFGPTAERPSWVYVTSGHSNPWESERGADDSEEPDDTGVELLLETTEQGEWAIRALLNVLALDLLLCAGCYPGKPPLTPGDRISLRAPINGDEACLIRNVLVTHAADKWPGFAVPSGFVRLLTLTGATDGEVAYAKATNTDRLVEALRVANCYPVTATGRASLL